MIEDQLYRETILEIAKNPSNRGEISSPDLEAKLLNPLCGDEIKLQLTIKNKQSLRSNELEKLRIVEKAVFNGNGCAISQASASILATYIEGKTLNELKKIKSDDILKMVGINPSPARIGCALLSLNVLKEALKDAVEGQGR